MGGRALAATSISSAHHPAEPRSARLVEPIAAAPVKQNVIINLLEPVTLEHLNARTTVLLPVANFILTSSNLSNPV
jgi:hypothetical protein